MSKVDLTCKVSATFPQRQARRFDTEAHRKSILDTFIVRSILREKVVTATNINYCFYFLALYKSPGLYSEI